MLLAKKVLRRFKSMCYAEFDGFIHKMELPNFTGHISPKIDVIIESLNPNDIDRLVCAYGEDKKQNKWLLEERFRRGHKCIVAKKDEKIISSMWFGTREMYLSATSGRLFSNTKRFKLKENEAITYDTFTHTKFRGKRLSPAVRSTGIGCLAKEGIEKFYATTGLDNIANIRALERVGYKIEKKIHYSRLIFIHRRKIELINENSVYI